MSESKKVTSLPEMYFFAVLYPNSFFDDILKGKCFDFTELLKTGIVAGFLTFHKNMADEIQNNLKFMVSQQPKQIMMDLELEQEKLDRFCDIIKKTGKIDHSDFNVIFTNICHGSVLFSKYKDVEKPILVSSDMLEIIWGDDLLKAYFVAIASHPDLLSGQKMDNYSELIIEKYKKSAKGSKSKLKSKRGLWTEGQKEQVRERQNGKCLMCKKHPARWEYDHIDNDPSNMDLSNCQGLCPTCHSVKTHETG